MNDTPPPIPPLALPTPGSSVPESPPAPWIPRALATSAAAGIAAGYLVFGHSLGAGWAAFTLALVLAIAANRDHSNKSPVGRITLLVVLLATTITQTVFRPSITGTLVAALLAAYAAVTLLSPHRFSFVRSLLEGVSKILAAPCRPFQSFRHAASVGHAIRTTAAPLQTRTAGTRRTLSIILPAALVVLPFLVLLSLGNSILGDTFSRLFATLGDALQSLRLPSFARVSFVFLVTILTLALLWRTNPSNTLSRITATLQKSFPGPADHTVALWRTILALAGVNAVFFAANTIDVIYLWSEIPLPEQLTLSEFVHHGTANLILSVVTAAAVLSALFQQHRSVTRSKLVRNLAVAWIVQNLFLVYNVTLRLGSYIDNYGQSLKRLFLLIFIALVAIGFVLLAIRIIRDKSFAWLVGANLTALFTLTFVTQFWDARAYVAEKNFDLAKQWKTTHVNHLYIDTQLLADLGSSAWPTLIKIAGGADGFEVNEISNARRHLASITATHLPETVNLPWQSYSHHRQQTFAALGEYQSKSNTTAQNGR